VLRSFLDHDEVPLQHRPSIGALRSVRRFPELELTCNETKMSHRRYQ
jgi:hypothetical protein